MWNGFQKLFVWKVLRVRPLTTSIGPSVIPKKFIEGTTFPAGADDVMRKLLWEIRRSHRNTDCRWITNWTVSYDPSGTCDAMVVYLNTAFRCVMIIHRKRRLLSSTGISLASLGYYYPEFRKHGYIYLRDFRPTRDIPDDRKHL